MNSRHKKRAMSKWFAEMKGLPHARITANERQFIHKNIMVSWPRAVARATKTITSSMADISKAIKHAIEAMDKMADDCVEANERRAKLWWKHQGGKL